MPSETQPSTKAHLSRSAAFWALATILAAVLAAASAPSPLYVIYQARWGFSALTLTLVFAVYVLALLATLLCAGAVSDRTGRRPAILVALALQIVAMLGFVWADGVDWLYAARIVQGVGTGLATGALGAAILDFQPEDDPRLAPLVNGVAPMVGLGAGALLAGLLVQLAPSPLRVVYWVLLGAYVVAMLAVLAMPETVSPQSGWWRTLAPKVAVPAGLGRTFAAVAPGLVAVWALGGLYLSLGPSLAVSLLHSDSHLVGGLVIVALTGAGAISTVLLRAVEPRRAIVGGSLTLLSEAGHALLHHAAQIEAQLNAARADLHGLAEGSDTSVLRVGAFGSMASRLIPPAIARLAVHCPAVSVETEEALSDGDLFAAVQGGRLDAAFAELPLGPGAFDWQALLVDPPVLLVPAGSPLASSDSRPSLAEIARQPFVVDTSWRMLGLIEAEFAAAGLRLDARFRARSNAAVQGLVRAGLGVAIMPRLAVDLADPEVEAIDVEGLLPSRTVVCYWPSERRPEAALQAFLEAVAAVSAGIRAGLPEQNERVHLAA